MKWDLLKPCSNCPFLKKGGIALMPGRVREIGGLMLESQGGTFSCHKTVDRSGDDDEGRPRLPGPNERHCAGALIFAEKNENATQMMRIAERLRMYDARKMMADKEAVALVFDDLDQMLRGHLRCDGAATGTKPSRKPRRSR